jgi:hypothetical protein
MPKRAVDIHWHGSRVGSTNNAVLSLGYAFYPLTSTTLDDKLTVAEISRLIDVAFDPDFADLRGLTGVELE